MKEEIALLRAVSDTLEQVSVSGAENLDRLLGCLLLLRQVTEALRKKEETHAAIHETKSPADDEGSDGFCRS